MSYVAHCDRQGSGRYAFTFGFIIYDVFAFTLGHRQSEYSQPSPPSHIPRVPTLQLCTMDGLQRGGILRNGGHNWKHTKWTGDRQTDKPRTDETAYCKQLVHKYSVRAPAQGEVEGPRVYRMARAAGRRAEFGSTTP